MRKIILFTLVLLFAFVFEASAQINFNFNKIGLNLGYVNPEDPIESTIGFGARAELGTFMKNNITFGTLIDYWNKSYGQGTGFELNFSSVTVAPYVHYNFPDQGKFIPYAGGGMGLAFNSSEITTNYFGYGASTTSSSDTDLVLFGVGGVKMNLTNIFSGFAEARYQTGGLDVFSVVVGVYYHFGQIEK